MTPFSTSNYYKFVENRAAKFRDFFKGIVRFSTVFRILRKATKI